MLKKNNQICLFFKNLYLNSKKILPIVLLTFSMNAFSTSNAPDMAIQNIRSSGKFSGQHAKFVASVLNNTYKTNQQILNEREKLLSIQSEYKLTQTLSAEDSEWLNDLANEYKVASPNFTKAATWQELDKRVDIVPASLVLAQAIQESGWGTSHIARYGNNYFGQECFSRGCGIDAGKGSRTGYATYADIGEAIETYIHNLNSNRAYTAMRNIRYQERAHNEEVNSIELVNGLTAYSELRGHYINAIKNVVNHLHLQEFDRID